MALIGTGLALKRPATGILQAKPRAPHFMPGTHQSGSYAPFPRNAALLCNAARFTNGAGMRHLFLAVAFILTAFPLHAGQDSAVAAVASLTDPAKLATPSDKRVANPQLLKAVYWLNDARSRSLDAENAIADAQSVTAGSGADALSCLVSAGEIP